MSKRERLLIKISGASLKSNDEVFDVQKAKDIINQLKILHKKYDISLVIGGGNLFRGDASKKFMLDRYRADQLGMLSTMINGILFNDLCLKENLKTHLFSAIKIDTFIDYYTVREVNNSLSNNEICIFCGGTGSAFFTTDTGAALRAAETNTNWILVGKNGVDGVYNKDPKIHNDAKRYDFLTYNDVIVDDLKVMDHSALTLCGDNDIKLIVFNINHQNSLIKAMEKEIPTTIIEKEKTNDWLK